MSTRAMIGVALRGGRLTAALSLTLGLAACDSGETTPPDQGKGQERVEDLTPAAAAEGPDILLRGAKVMTAAGDIFERADVLVIDGRIAAVGETVDIPEGVDVEIIEAGGKVVTPGIIDTHSHMGVYASPGLQAHSDGNEAVAAATAYAWTRDGIWPQDPQFDTARAGGVTTVQVLPGSANLIGGRSYTIKLMPHARSADDMHVKGAPDGLKMACGENPKRVYGEKGGPQTRMGNVAGYRKAFQEATEYAAERARFEEKKGAKRKKSEDAPTPPTRDFAKETLARVLSGDIDVHMHCYRADEMLLMLDLAEEFGFRIRSFHHAVEAYKIADVLAETETSVSVWADWWGFKAEAFDGVRENAALVSQAGARPIIHSDDPEGVQRLNQEAAKAMYAGHRVGIDVSEDEALKWITLYPAWALRIEKRTGSIEAGKDADLVVWNGDPFSVYAKAEMVFIEGERVYDRVNTRHQHRTDFDLGFGPGDYTREVSQ